MHLMRWLMDAYYWMFFHFLPSQNGTDSTNGNQGDKLKVGLSVRAAFLSIRHRSLCYWLGTSYSQPVNNQDKSIVINLSGQCFVTG